MPLESITATTATSNSKTPLSLENAMFKVFNTSEPKLSGMTPSKAHTETSEKVFAIASLTGVCQYGDSCKYFHPKNNLQNLNYQGMSGNTIIGDSMGVSWGNLPPSLEPPPAFVDWG